MVYYSCTFNYGANMEAFLYDKLWTYQDVADYLRCSVRHVCDSYVKTDLLPAVRLGRSVRFRPEDVQALVSRLCAQVEVMS